MNAIVLKKHGGWWFARFLGPHRVDVVRMMRSDTVWTGSRDNVSGDWIKARIKRLNPKAQVLLANQ